MTVTRRGVLVGALGMGAAAVAGATTTPAEASTRHGRSVRIYLARHGQTWMNLLDRVQGWSDTPLTAAGETTARTVGKNLAAEVGRFDVAYSADMVRHFSTASLMLEGARSRLTPTRVADLREVAFGGFEGSHNEEMWAAVLGKLGFATPAEAFASGLTLADVVDVIPTVNPVPALAAETSSVVGARMYDALTTIAKNQQRRAGGAVLAVSSGLSITCLLFRLGAGDRVPATGLANGAVNLLEYGSNGRWTVKTVNDTHYAS